MTESEPLEITIWREYKARLTAGEESKAIVESIAARLDKGIGYIANLIWKAEFESGEYYCRISGIDNLQWALEEQ